MKITTFLHKDKEITERLVNLIVKDMQPFSIVEDQGFRELMSLVKVWLQQLSMSMSKESVSNSILIFLSLSIAALASIICTDIKAMHLLRAVMAFLFLWYPYGFQVRSCSLLILITWRTLAKQEVLLRIGPLAKLGR